MKKFYWTAILVLIFNVSTGNAMGRNSQKIQEIDLGIEFLNLPFDIQATIIVQYLSVWDAYQLAKCRPDLYRGIDQLGLPLKLLARIDAIVRKINSEHSNRHGALASLMEELRRKLIQIESLMKLDQFMCYSLRIRILDMIREKLIQSQNAYLNSYYHEEHHYRNKINALKAMGRLYSYDQLERNRLERVTKKLESQYQDLFLTGSNIERYLGRPKSVLWVEANGFYHDLF